MLHGPEDKLKQTHIYASHPERETQQYAIRFARHILFTRLLKSLVSLLRETGYQK